MAEENSTHTKKLDTKSKTTTTANNTTKEDRKRKRDEKRRHKQQLLDQIPKRDKDGISYTKQQIRRMVRRVKRGLPPVPTPEEEAALRQQEAQLKREEELELAGMMYQRDNEKIKEDDDDDDDEEEDGDGSDDEEEDGGGNDDIEEDHSEENHQSADEDDENDKEEHQENGTAQDDNQRPVSKKRRLSKKPVPPDYVCQACKNKHNFPHWIYDCPDKQTIKGINRVAAGKAQSGSGSGSGGTSTINAPSAKKVFVSGLLFHAKVQDVKAIFKQCGKITSCKLLTFPDTGRCKGQAFVVFETEESARKALAMNGTKISANFDDDASGGAVDKQAKHKTTKASPTKKRELELKVTKVKSRLFTKKANK